MPPRHSPSRALSIFPPAVDLDAVNDEIPVVPDHDKRQTVPDTGQGVNFGIHQAMYAGFFYAFERGLPFQMHIEDIGYGDFDDLVILTSTAVHAYQYKSRVVADPAALGHFLTQSGHGKELMFYKYFDSLGERLKDGNSVLDESYILLSNQQLPAQLSKHVDEEGKFKDTFFNSEEPEVRLVRDLIYASIAKYSNVPSLPDIQLTGAQLADFLGWDLKVSTLTKTFKEELFVFAKQQLRKKGSRFSDAQKNLIINEYLEALKSNRPSVEIQALIVILKKYNKATHTINLYELACASFVKNAANITILLKRLVFKFGQPSLKQLIKINRQKISDYFQTTNDAIYHAYFHEFYDWLIAHVGTKVDNLRMKQLFAGWKHKYIYLERLCGLTKLKLDNIDDKISGHSFPRTTELVKLTDFAQVEPSAVKKDAIAIGILQGRAGVGKSCLVKKLIVSLKQIDGVCLFVDARDLWRLVKEGSDAQAVGEFSVEHLWGVKLICLDNAELIPEDPDLLKFIIRFVQELKKTQVRLILLTKANELPAQLFSDRNSYHSLTVGPIDLEEVLATYPQLNRLLTLDEETGGASSNSVEGTKPPPIYMDEADDEDQPQTQHIIPFKGMAELLTIPFYLNLIIKFSEAIPRTANFYRHLSTSLELFITSLAIEKPSPQSALALPQVKSEQRKAVLRRIVYANNKDKGIAYAAETDYEVIKELIADGILKHRETRWAPGFPRLPTLRTYRFTHLLYREWIVRDIVNVRLTMVLESGDEIGRLIDDLSRLLSEDRYIWGEMLRHNEPIENIIRQRNKYFINEANNFENLARIAIYTKNQVLFEQCYALLRRPTKPLSTRGPVITLLGDAISARNKPAASFLLQNHAPISATWIEVDYDIEETPTEDEYYADVHDQHVMEMSDASSGFYTVAPPHNPKFPTSLYQLEKVARTNDSEMVELVLGYVSNTLLVEDVPMHYFSSDRDGDDDERIPWYHETILHIAVSNNYVALVDALSKLLNNAALVNQDFYRHTPLHRAVFNSQFSQETYPDHSEAALKSYRIFKCLLDEYIKRKLNLDGQDVLGRTALHLAVLMRDPVMASALICAGASLTIEDNDGVTPQDMMDGVNEELKIKIEPDEVISLPDLSLHQTRITDFFALPGPSDSEPDLESEPASESEPEEEYPLNKKKRKATAVLTGGTAAKRLHDIPRPHIPAFIQVPRTAQQDGWSCFDIAVGLQRKDLVEFALNSDPVRNAEFRQLLAPEIRNAAAITADMANQEGMHAKNLAELFNLFEVASEHGEAENQQEVVRAIDAALGSSSNKLAILHRYALPEGMRTPLVQELINNYCDAHELMQPAVNICNDKLNLPGPRLTLAELDNFFTSHLNQTKYADAYSDFVEHRAAIFTPSADKLSAYCLDRTTYESYVKNYYGERNWFAFQPCYGGSYQTSMVDIAAKFLDAQIIIYQMERGCFKELYRTANNANKRYVQFTGNHFIGLQLNPRYIPAQAVQNMGLFKIVSPAPPQSANEEGIAKLVASYLR